MMNNTLKKDRKSLNLTTLGFTLIELLAVIVILAIIAVIATPIVLDIINDSKKSAILRSAEFYLSAVELSATNYMMKGNNIAGGTYKIMVDGNVCLGTLSNNYCSGYILKVEVKGEKPTSGLITLESGKIASYKNLNIDKDYVSLSENGPFISDKEITTSVCMSTTESTKTTGNVPQGNYENGDEYICEVKSGMFYHFFVIGKEPNGEINLIVDRNMKEGGIPANSKADNPAWITYLDYNSNNNIVDTMCNATGKATCYNRGPITALNYLDLIVSDWTNLPLKEYKTNVDVVWGAASKDYVLHYVDVEQEPEYPSYELVRNTRARLIRIQEAWDNGCRFEYNEVIDGNKISYNTGSCPLYMINYAQYKYPEQLTNSKYDMKTKIDGIRGYWTSAVQSVSSESGNCVLGIYDTAAINCKYANITENFGIRPVITLSPMDLS